ncbi:permease-like cell division protein FtsX [Microcella sp.]|uniref:permease-like cell division protein FtsX n=1 Tax=Microcella sp. TaxID=1913979 RepID=UPI00256A1A90|nr:permease-like cell division protein FtsX [Microcella sp.]MBX9471251.1 permease-like cell division protein FtsX [Microcella sp.]
MRLGLVLSEVGQGLRRNLSMVISVVLVTFISLTFVGAAILLQMQITQMKSYWFDRAQVAVYLCTEFTTVGGCDQQPATPDQIATVQAQLESPTLAPFIDTFYFETQEEAFANFQEQFEGQAVADLVTPDLLPSAFWVNLVDPTQSAVLQDSLRGLAGVESVVDQRSLLDQIFDILNAASFTAVGVAALMLVAAALLIATTIRLSAFSRRREIGIMRLVGASNRFIQTPFIIEGVAAALIGSVLAGLAIVAIVEFFVQGYLAQTLPLTSFVGLSEALIVVPILLAAGAVLAALSANVAITRYLRV